MTKRQGLILVVNKVQLISYNGHSHTLSVWSIPTLVYGCGGLAYTCATDVTPVTTL